MRVRAIDWMRGLVMIIMTIDHASGMFNAGHLLTDGSFMYTPGTPLPAGQFFTRWITHLCAPTFVFLAGTSLALSKRLTDGYLLTRGLLIIALEPLWMSWVFVPGSVLLQVLWAIGASFVCMTVLRRVDERTLLVLALIVLGAGEWIGHQLPYSMPGAILLTAGRFRWLIAAYPLLPWLSIMVLGFCFGRWMQRRNVERVERFLVIAGLGLLALFAIVRGLNRYGNMGLLRDDGSTLSQDVVQWLHVSKYPPSVTFVSLELGIMALVLAVLFRIQRAEDPIWTRPLLVFGQTAFFFYLLHVHLLRLAAWALHLLDRGNLAEAYIAWVSALLVLYPACIAYGRYKRANPDGFTRYV
jgi:uncharacterized membrane protein